MVRQLGRIRVDMGIPIVLAGRDEDVTDVGFHRVKKRQFVVDLEVGGIVWVIFIFAGCWAGVTVFCGDVGDV